MALGNLFVSIRASTSEWAADLKKIQRETKTFENSLKPIAKAGDAMKDVGKAMTVGITAPLVAIAGFATKTGIDFESAFAGVRKTVNATEPELQKISQQFRDMSKEIPVTAVELSRIGEAAGQLGIATPDIAKFSRVMAELGVTTNLTSDEAATATAKFQNIFGAAGKDVDRFASTLVALGNAGASTEKDILDMGLRIAAAGRQVGLSQAQVLSFASSLSGVGINAEAGGSAISRVFLKMNDAVKGGGDALAGFAKVAGMSAAEFRKAFEEDAASATIAFIDGLARIKESGGNASTAIEGLVGKNIIIKDTLLRASGAVKQFNADLATGAKGWEENTAAAKEAEERYKTTASQLQILKNRLADVGVTIFQTLGPILRDTVIPFAQVVGEAIAKAADVFGTLPAPVKTAAVAIAALAAAAGPVLFVLGTLAGSIVQVTAALKLLSAAGISLGAITGLLPGLSGVSLAFGAMAAGAVALAAAVGVAVGMFANWIIKITGLQGALDKLIAATVNYIPVIGKYITGQNAVTEATVRTGNAQKDLVAELKKRNIAVDESRLSDSKYIAGLAQQVRTQTDVSKAADSHGKAVSAVSLAVKTATSDVAAINATLGSSKKAHDDTAEAAARHREKLAELSNFLRGAEDSLSAPIARLNAQFEILDTTVTKITPKLKAISMGPLLSDMELLDMALESNAGFTEEVVRRQSELTLAREKDNRAAKQSSKLAEEWSRAWSTAVGNIASQFAESVVESIFPRSDKIKSIEEQISDIKKAEQKERLDVDRDAEKKRLQASLDATGKSLDAQKKRLQREIEITKTGTAARKKAVTDLAALEGQIHQHKMNATKALSDFEARIRNEDTAAKEAERAEELRKLEKQLADEKNIFRKFAKAIDNIFLDLGKSLIKIFTTSVFTEIGKGFQSLIGDFAKTIGQKLSGIIPGLGGGAASVAGTATSGAGSVAGSVGGAVSGGIGLAGSLISGGLGALGGIVGGLMTKGNAKRTEENTQETRDWLELAVKTWNPLFHEMRWFQEHIEMNTRALTPAVAGDVRPTAASPQFNIEINVGAGASMTEVELRTRLIPALKDWITNNTQGITEVTAVAMRNAEPGLVTA